MSLSLIVFLIVAAVFAAMAIGSYLAYRSTRSTDDPPDQRE